MRVHQAMHQSHFDLESELLKNRLVFRSVSHAKRVPGIHNSIVQPVSVELPARRAVNLLKEKHAARRKRLMDALEGLHLRTSREVMKQIHSNNYVDRRA